MFITDYKLVETHEEELHYRGKKVHEDLIRTWIAEGWRPIGAPVFTNNRIYQSLVKDAPFKPRRITDHLILRAPDLDGLDGLIQARVKEGWHPRLGVSQFGDEFIQTMVMYEAED